MLDTNNRGDNGLRTALSMASVCGHFSASTASATQS